MNASTDAGETAAPSKAVLLGGAHGTMALARCLQRAGLEVWFITDEVSCACYSGAIRRVITWAGANAPDALDVLEKIARDHSLSGSILIPGGDPDVRLVSMASARLSSAFIVMVPPWEQLRWACDKALASRRARELGLASPRVFERGALDDPALADLRYPLVLKPSMRLDRNRFTADRGWRIDDAESFRERYAAACELVGADGVVAQQLIPGSGETQLSYAGLWNRGEPVIGLTARRLRQYPVEFGVTSTYVETAALPDVAAAAETFLRSIRHHGLVEIEFKRDPRDGAPKLLDVNPRPWNWLAIGAAAGIDFGRAIRAVVSGHEVTPARARDGVAWVFASRDVVAAAASGRLRPRAILGYAATLAHARSFACFSWSDPLPAVMDLSISAGKILHRRGRRWTDAREEFKRART